MAGESPCDRDSALSRPGREAYSAPPRELASVPWKTLAARCRAGGARDLHRDHRGGSSVPHLDTGNTGFMLLCSSLVMPMTPGLACFYGGLVGRRNVIAIMIQSF